MSISDKEIKKVSEIVSEMIQRLGLAAEVNAMEREGEIVISLETSDPGRLIGRKGKSVDSLEYLVNRILSHHEEDFPRAVLDVLGSDEKTEPGHKAERRPPKRPRETEKDTKQDEHFEKIARLARDAAKEVKRWGEAKEIGPYNEDDRRIIHVSLQDFNEVVAETDPEADENAQLKKMILKPAEE